MLQRIKKVEYLENYKLKIYFINNIVKIVDFEGWIRNGKGYLLPLKKIEYFKKVRVDDCQYTICWPNGADFCPDVLYEIGEEVKLPVKKIERKNQTGKNSHPSLTHLKRS